MAGIAVLDGMQRELMALPNVRGLIIVQNDSGLPVRSTVHKNVAATIVHHVLKIIPKATGVLSEVDPYDALLFFRIRGANFEYLVYCEHEYTMIAVQEHTSLSREGGTSAALTMVTEGANANAARNVNRESDRAENRNQRNAKKFVDTDLNFLQVNLGPRM